MNNSPLISVGRFWRAAYGCATFDRGDASQAFLKIQPQLRPRLHASSDEWRWHGRHILKPAPISAYPLGELTPPPWLKDWPDDFCGFDSLLSHKLIRTSIGWGVGRVAGAGAHLVARPITLVWETSLIAGGATSAGATTSTGPQISDRPRRALSTARPRSESARHSDSSRETF